MKLVITGAAGHIGSFLIRYLSTQFPNSKFVLIDNLSTQRFSSLFDLPDSGSYKFIESDIRDMDLLPILLDSDVVIHLAATTDATSSFLNANILEANNYGSTLKVVEACEQTDTRLLMISTTSVYGSQRNLVSEKCPVEDLRPQSPYAATKLKEENIVNSLTSQGKLKSTIFRLGTIYGVSPGMRFHTAVNKFCWQSVMGQPLTVWESAFDQKRPYLDLLDAARAISFAISKDLFEGDLYNIVTKNLTVREVVETIQEFVPKLKVEFVNNQIMNQLSYEVSSDKIQSAGFKFVGNLRNGVSDTVKLLRNSNTLQNH
jgi:UDP-glucose 4-epimerase